MQLHNLKRENSNKKSRLVGRGGKRGKTSGKGTKGQKSRSGRKLRPEMRDLIKKIPKKRGYGKNRGKTVNAGVVKPVIVNVSVLETRLSSGDQVTPKFLIDKKIINKVKGAIPQVKILGNGDIKKKINFTGFIVSKQAEEKIKKAGGSIK